MKRLQGTETGPVAYDIALGITIAWMTKKTLINIMEIPEYTGGGQVGNLGWT